MLANRLLEVTSELLSSNQLAFTRGRLISSNIFLAEVPIRGFDQWSTPRRACHVLDLSKAFDSVSWKAPMKILKAMRFSALIRKLIFECISTTSFSLLIEGEVINQFSSGRGLRKGDLLSPILFILTMEHFSPLCHLAIRRGDLEMYIMGGTSSVSHLLYANDVLSFMKVAKKLIIRDS